MNCQICKLEIPLTRRAEADHYSGKISHREAEKRSLISHARHSHTGYEKALCVIYVPPLTSIQKARLKDHYNDIARKKLGLGKRRHSWEAEATGEARKQRRLE